MDGLMAGALLATLVRAEDFQPSRHTRAAWVAVLLSAPLAVLTDIPGNRWFVHSLAVVAAISFVYLALFSVQRWFQAAMKNRFLMTIGTISYGLYLLHKIPLDVTKLQRFSVNPFLVTPAVFAVTFGFATLSWNLLERPFLRLKDRFVAGDRWSAVEMPRPQPGYLEAARARVASGGLPR